MSFTFDELFEAYLSCRRNKRSKSSSLSFEIDDAVLLNQLFKELNNLTYEPSPLICFVVTRPRPREVFASQYRDRIVQHLIVNRILPEIESDLYKKSFSCRIDKGTYFGIKSCYLDLKNSPDDYWVFKGDIRGFFMHINKNILYEKLKKYIHDEFTDFLIQKVIFQDIRHNCIKVGDRKLFDLITPDKSIFFCDVFHGLPIGNITSQIFSNVYMDEFDRFMLSIFGEFYGRYADDFYIIAPKEVISKNIRYIEEKLITLDLTLHDKKRYFQHKSKGLNFIGANIHGNRIFPTTKYRNSMKNCLLEGHYETLVQYCNTITWMKSHNLRSSLIMTMASQINI